MKPIRGGLLSGVGVALVLLALAPATSWATFPGANGRIAFAGRPGGTQNYDIFTVLPSGFGLQQLTHDRPGEIDPSWSAHGQRLVYIDGAGALGGQVFTMSAEGENRRRVVHDNGEDSSPSFSPNGRRIVYSKDNLPVADRDTPRRLSIFKIRTDGTERRRLVTGYVSTPTFSPEGNRIVFQGTPEGKRGQGIWTIRPDGSHLRRLTYAEGAGWDYDESLDWSPTGRHILFRRCEEFASPGADCHDWVMRPDGSHKHAVEGTGFDTVYSPSGRRFAFFAGETDYCTDIYTTSVSGSDPHAVTHNCEDLYNGGDAYSPSWQPIPQP
jgi:Tol biopolymer transport system component